MIRTLEEQFGTSRAVSIRSLIKRINQLNLPPGASRYYAAELAHCLEAGALLGSLHVSASLLEIVLRGVVAERLTNADPNTKDWEHRLEETRSLGFKNLVDHLVDAGLFDEADGTVAKDFYNLVRIPVHHGLVGRYVTTHDDIQAMLRPLLGVSMPTQSNNLEDVVEALALPQIESAVGIIERNSV